MLKLIIEKSKYIWKRKRFLKQDCIVRVVFRNGATMEMQSNSRI
jgi:hypothetical protein